MRRTRTDVAENSRSRCDAKSHSGRGRQQKRFRQSDWYSGNVWHAKCDSVSIARPVTPPAPGNLCHVGSLNGCRESSRIRLPKRSCSFERSCSAAVSQPCASTTHSHPPVKSTMSYCTAIAVPTRTRNRTSPASEWACRIRRRTWSPHRAQPEAQQRAQPQQAAELAAVAVVAHEAAWHSPSAEPSQSLLQGPPPPRQALHPR